MDLRQLRCAVAAAEEMHFGRAAARLEMLPAALGRAIRQLEDSLGVALFERTTRSVAVTLEGARILGEARRLLDEADAAERRWRSLGRKAGKTVRLGAMDSAASGLVPTLLADLAREAPDIRVQLVEDRSIRLLPARSFGRSRIERSSPAASTWRWSGRACAPSTAGSAPNSCSTRRRSSCSPPRIRWPARTRSPSRHSPTRR